MAEGGSFLLWLAWAAFGSYLVGLVWKCFLPAIREAPPPPREAVEAPPAWLFCEEGAALDRRVRWFDLRPGGCTVIGARPRAATGAAHYLYLTAEDILEDHARITFNGDRGRYEVEALGTARHNNEPLAPGVRGELVDGDTLDLAGITRFRFTLTGPEADGE